MGRRLTPITVIPSEHTNGNHRASSGLIVGREVISDQFSPLFDAVEREGLLEPGVELRKPDPDDKRRLRVEILKPHTLRTPEIARGLGNTTIHQVFAKANEQHDRQGSPLFSGRELMFRVSTVNLDNRTGNCYINLRTLRESTEEMQVDGEFVLSALQAASGADLDLHFNSFGMAIAQVNLGRNNSDQSLSLANKIGTVISEPLGGLAMQFDVVGYDTPPPPYQGSRR